MAKVVFRWAGRVLSLVSVVFVFWLLWKNLGQIESKPDWASVVAPFVVVVVCYCLSAFLVARGWYENVRAFPAELLRWDTAWRIFGRAQIAKYVPGNIVHLAGRHVLGRAIGLSHKSLAAATILEAGGVTTAALMVGLMLSPQFLPISGPMLLYGGGTCVVLMLSILALLHRKYRRVHVLRIARAGIAYLVFFAATGAVSALLLSALSGQPIGLMLAPAIAAYALSWTAGFVIPGAPGGLGVREAGLVLSLKGLAPEADLVLFAVLLRVATILGDLVFFAVATFSAPPADAAKSSSLDGHSR